METVLSSNSSLEENVENITGNIFESKYSHIYFFISHLTKMTTNSLTFSIKSYILSNGELTGFDKLSFSADELNSFYDVRKGITSDINNNSGEVKILLKSFSDVTVEIDSKDNGIDFKIILYISKAISHLSISPILLKSNLSLVFPRNQNKDILMKYYYLVYDLLCFLTYRKNVEINSCQIMNKSNDGKYIEVGRFFVNIDKDTYSESIYTKSMKILPYNLIKEYLANLIKLIIDNKLYFQHIPYNSRDMLTMTPSRFVMITAAFEYTFNEIYGKNYKTDNIIEKIKGPLLEFLKKMKEESTGKLKKRAKGFYKYIEASGFNLADKIKFALDDHFEEISIFIDHIYKINKIETPTTLKIAERIEKQRNNYAHGNISNEIDPNVMLDLFIMECLIYTMTLRKIGMNENEIKKSIKKLFDITIML